MNFGLTFYKNGDIVLLNMVLEKITSLADLEWKVKTNSYYRQLIMISYAVICGRVHGSFQGKPVSDDEFKKTLDLFHSKVKYSYNNCSVVCDKINALCYLVKEEPKTVQSEIDFSKTTPTSITDVNLTGFSIRNEKINCTTNYYKSIMYNQYYYSSNTETDDESYLDFWKTPLSGDVSTTT